MPDNLLIDLHTKGINGVSTYKSMTNMTNILSQTVNGLRAIV